MPRPPRWPAGPALPVLAILALAACEEEPRGDATFEELQRLAEIPSHQIAHLRTLGPGEDCPEVDGWSASTLLEIAPGDLWCRYTYPDPDPGWFALRRLTRTLAPLVGPGDGPMPDRAVISVVQAPASLGPDTSYDQQMQKLLAVRFHQRAGTLELVEPNASAKVRLTLIDTSPTASGSEAFTIGASERHGHGLANLARELLLLPGTEQDAVDLRTRQALRIPFHSTLMSGSQRQDKEERARSSTLAGAPMLGTVADLAQAIDQETLAWQEETPDEHLILNLSIGWMPGPKDAPSDPLAEAARSALLRARCQGAVIFAAAGNQSGGGGQKLQHGLVLPAAWTFDAVTRERCEEVGVDDPRLFPGEGAPERFPLLLAIGGVENAGPELSVGRPEGLPTLLASGDHAVPMTQDGSMLPAMTGTSVSALLVSATAAALWTDQPDLSAARLERTLLDAGLAPASPVPDTITTPDADVTAFGPDGEVWKKPRLIHLCTGQEPADLAVGTYSCERDPSDLGPTPLDLTTALTALEENTTRVTLPEYQEASASDQCELAHVFCPSEGDLSGFGLRSCTGEEIQDLQGLDAACLADLRSGPVIAPAVWPQPNWPDCRHCLVQLSAGEVSITVESSLLRTSSQVQVELELSEGTSRSRQIYPLPVGTTATTAYTTFALAMPEGETAVGSRLLVADRSGAIKVLPLSLGITAGGS